MRSMIVSICAVSPLASSYGDMMWELTWDCYTLQRSQRVRR